MRPPRPLPAALQGCVFSSAEAEAHGVPYSRLRRRDIERVGRGRFRQVPGLAPTTTAGRSKPITSQGRAPDAALPEPGVEPGPGLEPARDGMSEQSRTDEQGKDGEIYRWSPPLSRPMLARLGAALAGREAAAASHETAARLQNLWLPHRLHDQQILHISRPRRHGALRAPGLITHRTFITAGEVCTLTVDGRRMEVTSHPRLWADLGRTLTESELVVLGEHLMRRAVESREELLRRGPELLAHLRAAALSSAGRAARRRLLRALARMRLGADSPPETELRLAIIEAGLPEPELQIRESAVSGWPIRTATADMGWRSAKIVVQYEGEHHGHQIADDVDRDAIFQSRGYIVIRVSKRDRRQGFRAVIQTLRTLLAERTPA